MSVIKIELNNEVFVKEVKKCLRSKNTYALSIVYNFENKELTYYMCDMETGENKNIKTNFEYTSAFAKRVRCLHITGAFFKGEEVLERLLDKEYVLACYPEFKTVSDDCWIDTVLITTGKKLNKKYRVDMLKRKSDVPFLIYRKETKENA